MAEVVDHAGHFGDGADDRTDRSHAIAGDAIGACPRRPWLSTLTPWTPEISDTDSIEESLRRSEFGFALAGTGLGLRHASERADHRSTAARKTSIRGASK